MNTKPIAAGKSSFGLVDAEKFFLELGPMQGVVFLDVACGAGAYSLVASEKVGETGAIYAVDLWKEGIEFLESQIQDRQIKNIHAGVGDVSGHLPLDDQSVDVCLMATVLHDLIQDRTDQGTMREVQRTLKQQGRLAVIEFKKIEGPPGPPAEIRLSEQELKAYLQAYGFEPVRSTDIGPYNYLALFTR